MDGKQIGIKLADGSFYPILAEDQPVRRRLVVTTVRDNQETVQIDLFRGEGELVEESQYVGSLMIENIQPAPMKEPEIEVVLDLDEGGNLEATATDALSGDSQSLSISLESLGGGGTATEFELEGESAAGGKSEEFEESLLTGETYPLSATDRRKEHLKKRRRNPLLLIGFVILSLILIAVIAFVVFRAIDGRPIPPLFGGPVQPLAEPAGTAAAAAAAAEPAQAQPAQAEPAQAQPAASPAAPAAAEAAKPAPAVPAAQAASPAASESGSAGAWYTIKWGDTLWDISATYYRNPWLYPKIARANNIANPDLIFAGRKLFIPEN